MKNEYNEGQWSLKNKEMIDKKKRKKLLEIWNTPTHGSIEMLRSSANTTIKPNHYNNKTKILNNTVAALKRLSKTS